MSLWVPAAAVAVFGVVGGLAWRRAWSQGRLLQELTASAPLAASWHPDQYPKLPDPVRKYFDLVLPVGLAAPRVVRMSQRGQIRTSTTSARWLEFTAEQAMTPGRPGFVWDAKVRIPPGFHVRVLDSLVNQRGAGSVALMSAIPAGADGGSFEMHSGTLHRYLAEAVWAPWALLPSERLSWAALHESAATATLTDGDTSVSLEFRFAPGGEVFAVYSPGRWGRFNGAFTQVGWEGHMSHYERRHGVLVPARGGVGWYQEGTPALVWKGEVTALSFE